MNKLALGSVQFGIPYGIASGYSQTSKNEVLKIIQLAQSSGISTLDTAINYGSAEEILGEIGVNEWNIVSKVPSIPEDIKDISKWLNKSIIGSLNKLNMPLLDAILLHDPEQLLSSRGDDIYAGLLELKTKGLVKKIGISIYDASILDKIREKFSQDLIQAPFNIFDRRLLTSGWLERLHNEKKEIHVRSVFLQGLFLMNSRPASFSKWGELLSKWEQWLNDTGLTALQACLLHALTEVRINKVIIGVHSYEQLKEIINLDLEQKVHVPSEFISNDLNLIEPSRWISK